MKRVHSNFLHDDESYKFNCGQCSCRFRKLASLNGHVTRVHASVKKDEKEEDEVEQLQRVLEQINALSGENRLENVVQEKPIEKKICINKNEELESVLVTIPNKYVEITDFDGRKYRVEHRRTENGRREVLCPMCNKAFSRPADLLRHRRIHTDEKPFHCDRCLAKFRTTNSLKSHQKSHDKATNTRAMNTTEQTRQQLIEIQNQLKSPEVTYAVVGYLLDTSIDPQSHQIIFLEPTNLETEEITTNENVIFDHQNNEKMLNPETETMVCDVNPSEAVIHVREKEVFTNLTQLRESNTGNLTVTTMNFVQNPIEIQKITESVTSVHEKKKIKRKHICQYCSKAFQRPSDVQRHERTHSKEKPFKCKLGFFFCIKFNFLRFFPHFRSRM